MDKPNHWFKSIYEYREDTELRSSMLSESPKDVEYLKMWTGETFIHTGGTAFWSNDEWNGFDIESMAINGITHYRLRNDVVPHYRFGGSDNHPWKMFLEARKQVIEWMLKDGLGYNYIAASLSMDALQVKQIHENSFRLEEAEQKQNPLPLQIERNETIAKLREICKIYGDNDWPDDLHMADILEKHLKVYIDHL